MSAEDIKFPPSERREVRQFEVPPWEQDQFEQLRQARAAQEAAEREAEKAAAEAAVAEEEVPSGAASESRGTEPLAAAGEPPSDANAWVVTPAEVAWEGSAPEAKVDEAEMDAMLAQLASQEESPTGSVAIVSTISAALLLVIGCVLIVWAMAGFVAARRTGIVGAFGGSVLLVFGVGFVAGGIWVWMRNVRGQGVR